MSKHDGTPPFDEHASRNEVLAFCPPINSERLEAAIRAYYCEEMPYEKVHSIHRERVHTALRPIIAGKAISFEELRPLQKTPLGEQRSHAAFLSIPPESRIYQIPRRLPAPPKIPELALKAREQQMHEKTTTPMDLVNLYFENDFVQRLTLCANFSLSIFEALTCEHTTFSRCTGHRAIIEQAYFEDCTFDACDFSYLTMSQGAELHKCRFTNHCNLEFTKWMHVVFDNVDFGDTELDYMQFSDVLFKNIDFTKLTRKQWLGLCRPGIEIDEATCKMPPQMRSNLQDIGVLPKDPPLKQLEGPPSPTLLPAPSNEPRKTERLNTGILDPDNVRKVEVSYADDTHARRVAAQELNRLSNAGQDELRARRAAAVSEGSVVDLSAHKRGR